MGRAAGRLAASLLTRCDTSLGGGTVTCLGSTTAGDADSPVARVSDFVAGD